MRWRVRLDRGNQDFYKGKNSVHNFVNYYTWTSIKLTGICFQRKLDMWHFKIPLWMAYLLLLFCGLAYSCGSAEYKINGKCCPMCAPGARVYKHCTEYTSTSCVPCPQKSFNDEPNGRLNCYRCTGCDPDLGLKTYRECTPYSDTVCGPLDHHYCTETDYKGCRFARKHTICGLGQFIKKEGTKTADTQCEECPHGYFSADGVKCTEWTKLDHGNQELHKGKKSDHNFVYYDRWTSIKLTAYLLLLFCGLAYSCGSAEYKINGKCCPMCAPGTRVYNHCTEFANTSCVPCTQKTFIAVPTGLSHCLSCTVCEPDLGLKTERECTPTSDTVCEPLDHHYCTKTDNKGCSFAQKHTICRPGEFIIHNGTTSTNTKCGYCPDKTFSNKSFSAYCRPHTDCQSLGLPEITVGTNSSDSECGPRNIPVSIVIVTVLVVLVSVVIFTIILILKHRSLCGRRKQYTVREKQAERERENIIELSQDAGRRKQNMVGHRSGRKRKNEQDRPAAG
ncbi:uncharacterized protein LOC135235340 isoform X3 [Anguilla rostrata]|uniref:uncharacterized protein LOC135235340 isoform X3 n=1 Tax=Anguilla rostrata TaxID=7938 RepID=UPI0030D0F52E